MTKRLYYTDSYLTQFEAQIVEASDEGQRIYLDRTAFYPTSGGQPFDLGAMGGIPVTEVVDEGDRVAHILSAPLLIPPRPIHAQIDWTRRFDHMQQHTAQHLLSAIFLEHLHAETISFHLGALSSTIDLKVESLEVAAVQEVERRANEMVCENRPVAVEFQDAGSAAADLRKASGREGTLRIVSIHGLDRSACGGTHVRSTGDIGPILIRRLDKVRGNVRVEFVCGGRAVRRARADYDALWRIGRAFSAPLDDTPELLAALLERAAESDKTARRLSAELAAARGRELYAQTQPDPDGVQRVTKRLDTMTEEARAEAQSFTAGAKAVMLMACANPPSALLAASKDSGFNAGAWLKAAFSQIGGKGGGSATLAQGGLPTQAALEMVIDRFRTGV